MTIPPGTSATPTGDTIAGVDDAFDDVTRATFASAVPHASAAPALPRPDALQAPAQTSAMAYAKWLGEEVWALVKTLASAAVYATLIVTFGFQVARVEGQSMVPTLQDQDRLIVNKAVYQMPSWAGGHTPQIGDIVMLYYPVNPSKSFVKRVIAGPNDTVKSVNGRVYRNDVPVRDDFIPEQYRSYDDWGPISVPEGYYWVMGDHRNNSSDSRSWSFVPEKYIIGRVELRWWPLNTARFF